MIYRAHDFTIGTVNKNHMKGNYKMKKTILALSMMAAISPAHAIWQGESLIASDNPQVVKLNNCSGTVIGNKYVLTAGHCGDGAGTNAVDGNGKVVQVTKTHLNPLYDASVARIYDVALWELATPMTSGFLSASEPAKDAMSSISGWEGGTLKKAELKALGPVNPLFSEDAFELLYDPANGIGSGMSRPGDSGGPCYTQDGVWGTIHGAGGQGDGTYIQVCQRVTNANTRQWILETVNGWSYPLELKGDGAVSVKVQSVHAGAEAFTPWVEGNVELISNSCSGGIVDPLAVCNLTVKGSGKLYLTAQDVIEINKQVEPPQPPTPEENGGGGGGGSSSPVMLAMMAMAAILRRLIK